MWVVGTEILVIVIGKFFNQRQLCPELHVGLPLVLARTIESSVPNGFVLPLGRGYQRHSLLSTNSQGEIPHFPSLGNEKKE